MVMYHGDDVSLHYVYLKCTTAQASNAQASNNVQAPNNVQALIVCIHGLFVGNLASWYSIATHLSSSHNVLLYDLRGHGRSSCPTEKYSLSDMVTDLNLLLEHLGWKQHPIILMGHSYGAAVATHWALTYPQWTQALVLLDMPFPLSHLPHQWTYTASQTDQALAIKSPDHGPNIEVLSREASHTEGMSTETLSTDPLDQLWQQLPEVIQAVLQHSPRKAKRLLTRWFLLIDQSTLLHDLSTENTLLESDFTHLKCPLLTVFGTQSDCFQVQSMLRQHIPYACHHSIDQAGHFLLNEAPHQVQTLIQDFISHINKGRSCTKDQVQSSKK